MLPSRVAALLFGSGACALVYQVVWFRELRLVFGASTPANAAVLAVFMAGLGLGSARLGRRAEAAPRPLRLYGTLELGIAITAALSPIFVQGARAIYVAAGGSVALGTFGGTLLRLLLSAVVLLPPTFLMGGTLPAAATAATAAGDVDRRATALLYGANAAGAVVGAAASTFVLLEVFGLRLTLWLACALNALIAVVARGLTVPPREAPAVVAEEAPAAAPRRFVLAAAAATGFVFFLLELVWYRMLAPLLGGSTYTFGLILAVALAGIGIGGLLFARRRGPATLVHFAVTCGLEAMFVAIPFALGDRIAFAALGLRTWGMGGFAGLVAGWTLVAALVVFPAAIVSGYQFPLLIALLGRGREGLGRHVGQAYASNTVGSILGSLGGGFVVLPWLSALGTWSLATALLIALGLTALGLSASARASSLPAAAFAAVSAVLAAALVALPIGPTAVWRHTPIGVGRVDGIVAERSPNALRRFVHERRAAMTWEVDGRESSIALSTLNDTSFIVSGKSDGAAVEDSATQVMGGMVGALLQPELSRVLVIGLGTGSTAGWLASLDRVERVDVVEIEPAMVEVARACAPVNRDVLDNPKVHLLFADAREVLLSTPDRYDLIFSEPSNPYRAGIASLFSREFYAAAEARLRPGGTFIQWVQAYEIDVETVRTVYATLATTFPSVETWRGDVSDLLMLARREDPSYAASEVRARMQEPAMREALVVAWRATTLEQAFAHFVAGPDFARAVAREAGPSRVNTDDRNLLEFGVARALGREAILEPTALSTLAVSRGWGQPAVEGEVDWRAVLRAYVSMGMAPTATPRPVAPPVADARLERRRRYLAAWAAGSDQVAVDAFAGPQISTVDALALGEAKARLGDAAAIDLAAALRPFIPVEAAAIEATYWQRAGRTDRALTAWMEAFGAYRTNPWASSRLMSRTLVLGLPLATALPSRADAMERLLAEPFAVHLLDIDRKRLRVRIAARLPDPGRCVAALAELEPYPPWERAFLAERLACYERAGAAEATAAAEDLRRFDRDAGMSPSALLP